MADCLGQPVAHAEPPQLRMRLFPLTVQERPGRCSLADGIKWCLDEARRERIRRNEAMDCLVFAAQHWQSLPAGVVDTDARDDAANPRHAIWGTFHPALMVCHLGQLKRLIDAFGSAA